MDMPMDTMSMEAYGNFARVYDEFMDNVPYDQWVQFLIDALAAQGITEGIAAELGCGTGMITQKMAGAGFDMIGIDSSVDMLEVAEERQLKAGEEACASGRRPSEILYLCQDIRSFELYGTVRAFYAMCNTMNYLLSEEDILTVFRLVNNYLDPGGIFLFDMVTDEFYREIGDSTIADSRAVGSLIWDNYYDEEGRINTYDITMYIRDDIDRLSGSGSQTLDASDTCSEFDDVTYHRSRELHYCRTYDLKVLKALAEEAGLQWIGAVDASTKREPDTSSIRWYIMLRECTKKA